MHRRVTEYTALDWHERSLGDREATVAETNGELRPSSISRILEALCALPEPYALCRESRFLDVGSGFGRVVFHTRMMVRCAQCHGVEYVLQRVALCFDLLDEFGGVWDMSGVQFMQADATRLERLQYTHLYLYDYVFTDEFFPAFVHLLQRSPDVRVLVSFRTQKPWSDAGLDRLGFTLWGSVGRCRTTGRTTHTARIYVREVEVEGE